MKLITLITVYTLILLTLSAPAIAIETKGNVITLSDDEKRTCNTGGGCEVIPACALGAAFLKMRQETYDQAYEAGANAGYHSGYEAGFKAAGKKI